MSNTVTLTFKISEDGTLKAMGQEAEKTAGKLGKAGKATDRFNTGQKGVAQAGMNQTKAFSKMRNEIGGGGSGLVGAYAGLAANIFALTATFGALSRAARATQLEEGLVAMGQASGLAMNTLSNGLVKATGNAISLEEAMRSTALITSAGIDPSSIERFGEVARKAAGALGRDVQDSISRLTRGVTKLEPELLDELGIMVRLDEASKTYADSLGKNVSELTSFEKRQAFLNATLEEGEKKFGALGDVDVNPFDKLSAAFANITKSGLGTLASILGPVVGYLAESPTALIGVLAAFAATISSQVLGSLTDMSAATAMQSKNMVKLNADTLKSLKPMNLASKSLDNVVLSMKDGNVSTKEYAAAMNGQMQSQRTNLSLLTRRQKLEADGVAITDSTGKALKKTGISQEVYNKRIENSKKIMSGLNIAQSQGRNSSAQLAAAKAQAALAEGRYGVALKNTKRALMLQINALKIAKKEVTTYAGAVNFARIAVSGLTMAAKTAGAAIMSMMGVVGMAVMVISMLVDGISALVNALKSEAYKAFEQQVEKINELTKELAGNVNEVNQFFETGTGKIFNTVKAYEALANILSTFDTEYQKLKVSGDGFSGSFKAQRDSIIELVGASGALNDKLTKNLEIESVSAALKSRNHKDNVTNLALIEEEIKTLLEQSRAAQAVGDAFKNAKTPLQEYANATAVRTELDNVTGAINEMRNSLLTTDEAGVVTLVPRLAETEDLTKILSEELDSTTAMLFNVTAEKKQLDDLVKADKAAKKAIADETERFNNLSWNTQSMQKKEFTQKMIELDKTAADVAAKLNDEDAQKVQKIITDKIESTKKLFNEEQERLQLFKEQEKTQKLNLDLLNQEKSNTVKSINDRMAAEENLRSLKETDAKARRKFAQDEIKRIEESEAKDVASMDRKALLLQTEKTLNGEIALLAGQALKPAEKTLKIEQTKMAALKETEKLSKAILDMAKKENKANSDNLSNTLKIAKLNQSIANRKAGIDGKLLPSQVALIEQDDEVLKKKVQGLVAEANTKKAALQLEKAMTKMRLQVLKAEVDVINQKRTDADSSAELIDITALDTTIAGLDATYSTLAKNINDELEIGLGTLTEQVSTTSTISMQTAERLKKEIEIDSILKSQHDAQKGILDEQKKQFEIRQSIREISNKDSAGNIKSAHEAAKIAQENRQAELVFAKAKEVLAKKTIKAENALLEAKFNLLRAEMEASGGILTTQEAAVLNASRTAMRLQQDLNDSKLETARLETEETAKRIAMEESAAHSAAGKAGGFAGAIASIFGTAAAGSVEGAVKGAKTTEEDPIVAKITASEDKANLIRNEANRLSKQANEHLENIVANTGTPVIVADPDPSPGSSREDTGITINKTKDPGIAEGARNEADNLAGNIDAVDASKVNGETENPVDKLKDTALTMGELRGTLQGAAKDMAALGPDGEGMSKLLLGADAMAAAFEMEGSAADKIGAGIGALSQIVGGAAQNKVNAVDKEIAAEKKRDGKSAASIAKIKALEKKKEQIERKAFNMKKKMSMAQVVISTAQAIMESAPNIPKMAFFGAMGALQLATIASTSYQGGGNSIAETGKPSEINMGSRENTVDLAKGNNAAGELAFMRGEDGIGKGATDFKPRGAFSGYKHRNTGGYVVGEQGPELFMPEMPGEIIPAGRVGGGEPTNVNFNISAVDATGVEDVLVRQKGHIIRMIREAANEHGHDFLEDIATETYR